MTPAPVASAGALPLDGRLWAFATRVYARDGAAEACLALQDEFGADVVLLLFGAWLGAEGLAPDREQLAAAARDIAPWRGEVVGVLRTLRRRLKTGPEPAPDAATDALRNTIKGAELAAEQIHLAWLERAAAPWLAAGGGADAATAVAHNLAACFEAATGSVPDDRAAAWLRTLAQRSAP